MNHRNLKIALASAALAVSGAAMADGPGWTYFQGQAGWGDAPDDGENTQYGASGSIQLFNMLHLGVTYTAGKFDATGIDDSDVDNWNIVFGSHVAVSDTADVFADVIFGNIDPDDLGDDSDYYGGRFGTRVMLTDRVEINGGAQAIYLDDSEGNSVNGFFGGRLAFGDNFSAGVTYTDDNIRFLEEDSLELDLRWTFGNPGWTGND
jgi:hypothetical protein